MDDKEEFFIPKEKLQTLLDILQKKNYRCVAPQVRDGAIVYDTLIDASRLPWGIRDYQAPGEYRLEQTGDHRAFSFANGPQAIKPFLFKPQETLWKVDRQENGNLFFTPNQSEEEPIAIIGAKACDLAAMAIQDKVFLTDKYVDPLYRARREKMLIIAVNCSYASNNCFCVSAGTGPEVTAHYDIVMSELQDGFTIRSGSERGNTIVTLLNLERATNEHINTAAQQIKKTAEMQTKKIPFNNSEKLKDILFSNLEHEQWEDVAKRCLSCGNCTSVCPTCFCHSEADVPSLEGTSSEHQREWDSCFTAGHSVINNHVQRDDTKKRYRQWLTHKVGSWFDQFGTSGCVGCGRCVSWCPVGIDLTAELAAMSGESNVVDKAK